jgi:hypothetical protein
VIFNTTELFFDTETKLMDPEYLIGYSSNILERTFRLYSNTGNVKEIVCETPQQFLNIVEYMEKTLKKEDWIDSKELVIVENEPE